MILAFTGAGISKSSGIPTFEEQPGIRDFLTRSFAKVNPEKYNSVIEEFKRKCDNCFPNEAHLALSEFNVPIITMNVDNLHERAGSKYVLPIHGKLPNIVLYGDPAPKYEIAHNWVGQMQQGDIFIVIGTSYFTTISIQLKIEAIAMGASVIEMNKDSEHLLRKFLVENKDKIGSFEEFLNRDNY